MRVSLSRAASVDVATIASAIGKGSRPAAQRFVDRVDRAIQRLTVLPESGVPRPGLGSDLRMIVLMPLPHNLVYRLGPNEVLVARVLDGRRDVKAVLDDE